LGVSSEPAVLQTATAQVDLWCVTCSNACGIGRRLRCIPRMSQAVRIGLRGWTISLGRLWRCTATTCGLADLRVYYHSDRERP